MPTIRWPIPVMPNSSVLPLHAIIWEMQMQCPSPLLLPVRNADVHINFSLLSSDHRWISPSRRLTKLQGAKTEPCRTVLNHFQTNEIQFQKIFRKCKSPPSLVTCFEALFPWSEKSLWSLLSSSSCYSFTFLNTWYFQLHNNLSNIKINQ